MADNAKPLTSPSWLLLFYALKILPKHWLKSRLRTGQMPVSRACCCWRPVSSCSPSFLTSSRVAGSLDTWWNISIGLYNGLYGLYTDYYKCRPKLCSEIYSLLDVLVKYTTWSCLSKIKLESIRLSACELGIVAANWRMQLRFN